LADAFARHRELVADLLQRVVSVHADAESHTQYTLLARREQVPVNVPDSRGFEAMTKDASD
jgi:hypothetical protein